MEGRRRAKAPRAADDDVGPGARLLKGTPHKAICRVCVSDTTRHVRAARMRLCKGGVCPVPFQEKTMQFQMAMAAAAYGGRLGELASHCPSDGTRVRAHGPHSPSPGWIKDCPHYKVPGGMRVEVGAVSRSSRRGSSIVTDDETRRVLGWQLGACRLGPPPPKHSQQCGNKSRAPDRSTDGGNKYVSGLLLRCRARNSECKHQ